MLDEDDAFSIDRIRDEFIRQFATGLAPLLAGGVLRADFPQELNSCLRGMMSKDAERKFAKS